MRLVHGLRALTLVSMVASSAGAHVELLDPKPRLPAQANGNQVKSKPCGQTNNMRTATVTTFKPGETIQVKIKEYIDHPGYFAVAFDADGDTDFPFPMANMDAVDAATDDPKATFPLSDKVLGFHLDAAAPKGDGNCASNADDTCTITVKLPNVQCQNCTLQVIQFMYDKLGDDNDNEYYYQCADLKLEGDLMPGTAGTGGMGGSAGAGGTPAGTAGSGGTAGTSAGASTGGAPGTAGTPSGGAPGTAGTASAAGTPGAAGTGAPAAAAAEDDGGCSVSSVGTRSPVGALSLAASLALGLGWLARRRNRPE